MGGFGRDRMSVIRYWYGINYGIKKEQEWEEREREEGKEWTGMNTVRKERNDRRSSKQSKSWVLIVDWLIAVLFVCLTVNHPRKRKERMKRKKRNKQTTFQISKICLILAFSSFSSSSFLFFSFHAPIIWPSLHPFHSPVKRATWHSQQNTPPAQPTRSNYRQTRP